MMKLKVLPVLAALLFLLPGTTMNSQIDIHISEYCASNIGAQTDNYGENSDWVEIRSTFSSSLSLASYYLSDDINNQFKWQFPASFVLKPGEVKIVWLSGRNEVKGDDVHANFTLNQCSSQELILSANTGVIRDRIAVRPTMEGHSRGRVANTKIGPDEWRVFTNPSFLQVNNTLDNYLDYAPTPQIHIVEAGKSWTASANGGFSPGTKMVRIRLNGVPYDTTTFDCFDVFYSISDYGMASNYPVVKYPEDGPTKSKRYTDSIKSAFPIAQSSVVRAIAVPKAWGNCPGRYLPSFCETNTYFINNDHQNFAPNFGALSLAFDKADTNFFAASSSRTVHVEYFDQEKFVCEGYAILSKPPQEKWMTKQKGFYLTMDDRLGKGCGFTGNIFNVEALGTSSRTMFPTLHVYGGDIESHSAPTAATDNRSRGTGIRDVFFQSIAAKHNLKVNPLHVKPVVAVKEGKYYGVFHLKEVFDKYYEEFYYGQPHEKLTLNYVQNGFENHVSYFDLTTSAFAPTDWKTEVYDLVTTQPMQLPSNYAMFESKVDVPSMIDYFVVNSFATNINLFHHDVAFGKGGDLAKQGSKWHFYLWNMPSTLSFTNIALPQQNAEYGYARTPCFYQSQNYVPSNTQFAMNGIGEVFKVLMNTKDNSGTTTQKFQTAFQNRYMDLLNGPFSCPSLLEHWKVIYDMYLPEMKRHDNPAISSFGTVADAWKKNMDSLKIVLNERCYFHEDNVFNNPDCFGKPGPFPITVDVRPEGSGYVRLNSTLIEEFDWSGRYYESPMSFKAIPTSTNYEFHHWEFANHVPYQPTSMDSVTIDFASTQGDRVVAVFTDKSIELNPGGDQSNLPTGFTPNGDGINDLFRPVGSAGFLTNYEMVIFNRWGQEIFRSTEPTAGWDGKYKGQDVMTGVYAYYVVYRNIQGEDKLVKGNVTLTR